MTIKVRCSCGRVLQAPDSAAGKKGRCPACGKVFRVPSPATPEKKPAGAGPSERPGRETPPPAPPPAAEEAAPPPAAEETVPQPAPPVEEPTPATPTPPAAQEPAAPPPEEPGPQAAAPEPEPAPTAGAAADANLIATGWWLPSGEFSLAAVAELFGGLKSASAPVRLEARAGGVAFVARPLVGSEKARLLLAIIAWIVYNFLYFVGTAVQILVNGLLFLLCMFALALNFGALWKCCRLVPEFFIRGIQFVIESFHVAGVFFPLMASFVKKGDFIYIPRALRDLAPEFLTLEAAEISQVQVVAASRIQLLHRWRRLGCLTKLALICALPLLLMVSPLLLLLYAYYRSRGVARMALGFVTGPPIPPPVPAESRARAFVKGGLFGLLARDIRKKRAENRQREEMDIEEDAERTIHFFLPDKLYADSFDHVREKVRGVCAPAELAEGYEEALS